MKTKITIELDSTIYEDFDKEIEFVDTDVEQFKAQVGVAGELIIYRQVHHKLLTASSDFVVYKVYNAGVWVMYTTEDLPHYQQIDEK